jgi:predicted GNAT family N-acyltransferase
MIEILKIESQVQLDLAHKIRHAVFVIEQQVDERLEYEYEESVQFLAKINNELAGTARWRKTEKGIKLERFAVLSKFRSSGVGSALLSAIIQDIPEKTYLYLHAQLSAMGLYSKFGFIAVGDQFTEADIEHFKMELK